MTTYPHTWAMACLGDVADIRLGKMLDKARPKGKPRQYLRNINVRWDSIDISDVLKMSFEDRELDRYGIKDGDLLVCEGGEPGRSAVWNHGDTDLKYQKALHRVRLPAGIAGRWVMYQLMLDAQTGQLSRHFTGSTIAHLPRERLTRYEILVASEREQGRIVETLDSYLTRLDGAVGSLQKAQARLKAYRASVLKAAVGGRLAPAEAELARHEGRSYEPADVLLARVLEERRRRWEEAELTKLKAAGKMPKDDKWKARYEEPTAPETSALPSLPEGWCWTTLDQLLTEPLANGKSVADGPGFPVLRLTSIKQGRVDLSARKTGDWGTIDPRQYTLKRDDFLIVRGNGSIHLVGKAGLVAEDAKDVAYPDTLIRARVDSATLLPALLSYWWDGPTVRTHMERRAKTTAGIHKVNQTDLAETPLPLPPLIEQGRILEELERLLSVSNAANQQVNRASLRAARLRQSMLKWAFEGKLVDHDPTDEPADVLLARIRAERLIAPPIKKNSRARKLKAAS